MSTSAAFVIFSALWLAGDVRDGRKAKGKGKAVKKAKDKGKGKAKEVREAQMLETPGNNSVGSNLMHGKLHILARGTKSRKTIQVISKARWRPCC